MSSERIRRFWSAESRELIELWEESDLSEKELEASMDVVRQRAQEAEMSFVEYIRAVMEGRPTEKPVAFVRYARRGTDETVGPECRVFLLRPDILRKVNLPYRLVESTLQRLEQEDRTVAGIDPDDLEVLEEVKTVWRQCWDKAKRGPGPEHRLRR